jgi:TolB-like protein/DNA-binding winged helix-turn-helix (wHTH) protein/Tfp pilus assembly protein PilF
MSGPPQHVYEFGPFVLDGRRRRLLRDGEPVPLPPKVLDTLLALVEHREHVLTKDELLRQVWEDTVVEEGGLTRNISVLRKTLGETPNDHQYIVTVPARGYRFVAEVRETTADGDATVEAESALRVEPVAPPKVGSSPNGRHPARRWWALGGLAVRALGAFAYLWRPAASPESGRPRIASIAVLPLGNLSGDPEQEYFADGMTEALIGNLARIRALRVVSRTSVMRFKGARPSLPEIGRALNVDAVIEGSVQRTHDRVRISIQLIHAPTDTHLWAREYDRELTDVLRLQGDVARAVSEEIRIQVSTEERARLASAGTVNPAVHREYLLGQYYLWKRNEDDLARAIDHFERATRLDPGYAAAYAGLSHAWWWRGIAGTKTLKEVESPSRAAAQRALELDPRLPEAHVSVGRIKYGHDWDWTGAGKDFSRALEIDPNSLDAHFFSAMLGMALGDFRESIAHIERAQQLDPLSSEVESAFGRILYRARRFEEAVAHLNQAIALEPRNHGAHYRLADVYEEMGRYAEAVALHEKVRAVGGSARVASLAIARIYARMGKRNEARRLLDTLPDQPSNAMQLAFAYVALGEKDEAFRLLFRNVETHDTWTAYTKTDPLLDDLHSDARWPVLLRRLNFPPNHGEDASGGGEPLPAGRGLGPSSPPR